MGMLTLRENTFQVEHGLSKGLVKETARAWDVLLDLTAGEVIEE